MSDLEVFRQETRTWLEENCPNSMRTPMTSEDDTVWGGRKETYNNPDAKLWLERMGARGWTAPAWPKEYGGGGLSKEEAGVLGQELGRISARPALASFGLWMLGPVLIEYGTEEQKKNIFRQSFEAKSAGAKDTPSRAPDQIWQDYKPKRC